MIKVCNQSLNGLFISTKYVILNVFRSYLRLPILFGSMLFSAMTSYNKVYCCYILI